ncbi:MAG: alpha-L-arabinofuranosidase C-terminal domain-containing protein [Bacteroidota bacterium]
MKLHRLLLFCIPGLLAVQACSNRTGSSGSKEAKNESIPNGSVEYVESSRVLNWTPAYGANNALHFYSPEAHDGARSLLITSDVPARGIWSCKVPVKPWSKYRFHGWIRTENLENGAHNGACFNLVGKSSEFRVLEADSCLRGLYGTNEWTEVVKEFETGGEDSFVLECLFNGYEPAKGRAWFDQMSLELLSSEKIDPNITIHPLTEKEEMSPYIYGQFIEHLGKCIYGGIWAEMLDDRKFWYAPGDRQSPWKIEGETDLISMDRQHPFTGEQTPVLKLSEFRRVALRQDGLGLVSGMEYNGRIIMKSKGKISALKLQLLDGKNLKVIDEVVLHDLRNDYTSFTFSFKSDISTHSASLRITPEGEGELWVGTLSLMPSNNVEGFRADVLALLKGLNSPVYRWPGGNFVSGYNWRDGIGDRDRRPPRKNPAWSGVEHNDVGIDEFITLCKLLNTEPYIAVNAGLGGAEEARAEVEYCNGSADTPMGRLRSQNGHPDPYRVKWWSVGNEMYGDWQLGHMSTDRFVQKHNQFADAMRSVDPEIKLIAVGNPGPWNELMLSRCNDNMDYISEHFYQQDWHGGGLMTHVRQVPDAIRERAELHRNYRRTIPELADKDIRICMDEWNYWYGPHIYGELGTRYFLRDALGIAAGLNEYSRNTDIIYMANYAQTVNVIGCIKTNTTESVYAATGEVLKMYRDLFGTIPVEISGEKRPFDMAAALSPDRKKLVLAVVNPTREKQVFECRIKDLDIGPEAERYVLTGPDDMAYNEPGRPEAVKVSGPELIVANGRYSVPRISVTMFVFTLDREE